MDHSRPTTITICQKSRSISKQNARVVHVYEPGIIETDPANFRELVQRLTGKEATKTHGRSHEEKVKKKAEDTENVRRGFPWRNLELLEGDGEEERESWRGSSSVEFSSDFGDMDLFFHGLCDSPDLLSAVLSFSYLEEI